MTEYILILIVSVSIILGGVYQLNAAFKTWANNYFGNYLSCLLETGELPTISGSPGDSGICQEVFQPFTLADGWQQRQNPGGGGGGETKKPVSPATPEKGSGGGGYYPSSGKFAAGRASGSGGRGGQVTGKGPAKVNTGDTSTTSYGSSGSSGRERSKGPGIVKYRVNNQFVFESEQDKPTRRNVSSITKPYETSKVGARMRLKDKRLAKDLNAADESEMTFSDFIRIIIIAAIVIALFMFLGGQMLSIGKSME